MADQARHDKKSNCASHIIITGLVLNLEPQQHNRPHPSKHKGLDICIDNCKYIGIVPCGYNSIEHCIG